MATKTKKKPAVPLERPQVMDDGAPFIPDVARTHAALTDDEAEAFAEELIVTATTAEDVGEEARDEVIGDELVALLLLPDTDEELGEPTFV